jgi:hypothetical protein
MGRGFNGVHETKGREVLYPGHRETYASGGNARRPVGRTLYPPFVEGKANRGVIPAELVVQSVKPR